MSHPEQEAPGSQPGDHDSDKIGLVIDERYRLHRLIGRGGMGTVYLAEHVGIGRQVAVKLVHPTLAQVPEIAQRFLREALAIGRIEHPNCVDITDSGKLDDGSLFLVMEYLEGRSAGDLMHDEGRIGPRRALGIMKHVLRGLGHVHKAGIIHRDIKPENIFLVEQDSDPEFAKILDFGIAKVIGAEQKDEVKLTQAGVAFGTPIYMSPEQAVGNPVDGRADLYAATVVLFELLAGRPPFYSDDKIEVLSMHTSRPPPSFDEVAPDSGIPAEVEELVHRGLAKKPGERFATTDEYIDAIDATLSAIGGADPVHVATPQPARVTTAPVVYGPPRRPTTRAPSVYPDPPSRRKLYIAGASVAGLVALALLVALFTREGDKVDEPSPLDPAVVAKTTAEEASELLAGGDPGGAVTLLESQLDAIADNPGAQMQLGHAYTSSGRHRDALRAYERAITLDEATLEDPALRTNLQALLIARDADVALDAADVLLSRLLDDVAATHLVDLASRSKDKHARHRARDLAEKHELLSRVDWVDSYALDLLQGTKCADRKRAVVKLEELGDVRAIEPLKKARFRKAKKGRYRGKNINGCLKTAANRAISALEKKLETTDDTGGKP